MADDAEKKKDIQIETDLLKLYDEKIIPIGITATDKEDEIIDIISDYPWSTHQFSQRTSEADKITYTHNIPFCYAIERQQTVNSAVTNIVNAILGSSYALVAAGTAGMKNLMGAKEESNKTQTSGSSGSSSGGSSSGSSSASSSTKTPKPTDSKETKEGEAPAKTESSKEASALNNFLSNPGSIMDYVSSVGTKVANYITPRLEESNLQGYQFLNPWRWLYFTKVTKKKYVFPTFNSTQLLQITNSWGEGESKITDFFENVIKMVDVPAEIAFGVRQFTDFLPNQGEGVSYEGYNIEKALGYAYNGGSGPEFKSDFVLFNTTKKDAWKKNYRFLILFILRNMALRTSMYSIKPPLLYDVIVPGAKHLPLCYIANISLEALGHVRNMTAENFLKEIVTDAKNATTLAPIPEAWRVSITFKCLIPDTMNLVLNTTNFPINVTTVTR